MAHESFEDEDVADYINKHFISIKLDREERPDLDHIYMTACQMMTGQGGWPLNLWLTPELKPVYAGTYFPKEDSYGKTGFHTVNKFLSDLWQKEPNKVLEKGKQIEGFIDQYTSKPSGSLEPLIIETAVNDYKKRFDKKFGGFSKAPKFPSPHQLLFLMDYYEKTKDEDIMPMVDNTLTSMYEGGLYDHVGGGFHRYAVDGHWLVPHFEKMLYDNALLLRAYSKAFYLTANPLYKQVVYGISNYLETILKDSDGTYYSAQDADSDGVEGKYYVYSLGEIESVLGDQANAFIDAYRITDSGNFEGKNIPNRIGLGQQNDEVLNKSLESLKTYREKRVKPSIDTKKIVELNAMLMGAYAYAYRVFGEGHFLEYAKGIYNGINGEIDSEGKLPRIMKRQKTENQGTLSDYAFYIEGALSLYQSTMDQRYLDKAISYEEKTKELFYDKDKGGYFMTTDQTKYLLYRPKNDYDGAIPSGASVMGLNLMTLSSLTEDSIYTERLDQLVNSLSGTLNKGPSYLAYLLISLLYRIKGHKSLVIALDDEIVEEVFEAERVRGLGYFTMRILPKELQTTKVVTDKKRTYYECENYACKQPVHEL